MAVANALHGAGWEVFVPLFGAHSRVDLIADRGTGPVRVQVKTARLVRGCVEFRTCSNTANVPIGYEGDVDVFGIYCPELEAVYVVPVAEVASRKGFLRVDPPRNGQDRRIRWARDYRVEPRRSP